MTALLAALALVAATAPTTPAGGGSYTLLAVAEPPEGPGTLLADLTHQLRTALRGEGHTVMEAPEIRARLLGPPPTATLQELDRAFASAEIAFERIDLEAARSAMRTIVGDLERLPPSAESRVRWLRAMVRLAYFEAYLRNGARSRAVIERVLATEPDLVIDEVRYPPSFRRQVEEARGRLAAGPKVKLEFTARGLEPVAWIDGRPVGKPPTSISLPPGSYLVAGVAGPVRTANLEIRLTAGEGKSGHVVELDLATAQAFRPHAGPGLALSAGARSEGIAKAGARLGATHVVAVQLLDAGGDDKEVRLLAGALHEVGSGSAAREGRVRIVGGAVLPADLTALARFLITGEPMAGVMAVAVAPPPPLIPLGPPPPPRPAWRRPAAYASGAVAVGLATFALWQGIAARSADDEARAMLRPDGTMIPGSDPIRHGTLRDEAASSSRNAYVGAAGAVAFAVVSGLLGYHSRDPAPVPQPLAVRF